MATRPEMLYGCILSRSRRIWSWFSLILILAGTQHAHSDSRIVGGEETTIDKVPYLVYIRNYGGFICGGTLVTERCVLTAAHCLQDFPADSLTVHAGASTLSEPNVERQVEEFFVPPKYSSSTLDFDVAILLLDEELSGQNITTVPICKRAPPAKHHVKISGWGYTNQNETTPTEHVQTANVRVLSRGECIRAYSHRERITSTMFCATDPGKDACSGDSGGPLIHEGEVCGVVSWGTGCGLAENPGVYTNVASLGVSSFLKKTIRRNCM